jgi:uncharacterized RDD family membrane protein YckC
MSVWSRRDAVPVVAVSDQLFHESHGARPALEGLPLASFGARALALAVDGLILVALLLAVRLPSAMLDRAPGTPIIISTDRLWDLLAVVVYFAGFTWASNGRTPGKWLSRVRVVSLHHDKLTLWQSVERALGYGASTLELGFGFLQYFLHANRQTVHDRIAGTIVAKTSARPTPPVVEQPSPPQVRAPRRGKRRRRRKH